MGLGILLPSQKVWAVKEICFCHETSSLDNPWDTVCTSDEGLIDGHLAHGDIPFGCYCGDGLCDPNDGEDSFTCPQDCGTAEGVCGNGQDNGWEDCGEPTLPDCEAPDTCIGCRCAPPPPECFYNEDCAQDGDVCNGSNVCAQGHLCTPTPPLNCDDGDACNGVETCDPTDGCQAGTPVVCDDQRECTTDSCDPQTGECLFDTTSCPCTTAQDCDDGNVCNGTEDCDLDTGCVAGTPLTCDDGDACNGVETCDPTNGCQAGTPVVCDDQLACSTDSCDPQTGECQFDVSACTCQTAVDCDDGDPCTEDTCNVQTNECSNVVNASLDGCNPSVPAVNEGITGVFEGSGSCSLQAAATFTDSYYGMFLFAMTSLGLLRLRRKK